MFDLNDSGLLGGSSIFNGGVAGVVEGVNMSVVKKTTEDNPSSPDVNFVFEDSNGSLRHGYYYYSTQGLDAESESKNQRKKVSQLVQIATALKPETEVFPPTTGLNVRQVEDMLINLIQQYSQNPEAKVSIFTTYGTKNRPSGYLRVRSFNFIAKAGSESVKNMKATPSDNMERIEATQTPTSGSSETDFFI